MASIRKKLLENLNDSKNTRMDIAGAGIQANWRPDELAHISRYCKITDLIIEEARRLGRPVDLLEAGCGQVWVLRYLYKAHVIKKSDVVRSYLGVDIDPACLTDIWSDDPVADAQWFKTTTTKGRLDIQDLTVNPTFERKNGTVDVAWTTEVIEHMLPDRVEAWIKDMARCLRKGGLAYVSTPNCDGSREKLPKDHVYEWGFAELKALLERYFTIESHLGVFIQMNRFEKVQKVQKRWPAELLTAIQTRFDNHWQRVILAAPYPEVSNNVAWVLRKR